MVLVKLRAIAVRDIISTRSGPRNPHTASSPITLIARHIQELQNDQCRARLQQCWTAETDQVLHAVGISYLPL